MAAVEEASCEEENDNIEASADSSNVSNNEQLLKDLCDEYSTYLNIDFHKQEKKLEDSIEEMLLRLDEFVALIDVVRSDNSQCLSRTLPTIFRKCECLEEIKHKIDKLETFVNVVRDNVNTMEEKVTLAEQELRQESSLEKVFKPFLWRKSVSTTRSPRKPVYEEPEIFKTSDYFPDESASQVDESVNLQNEEVDEIENTSKSATNNDELS